MDKSNQLNDIKTFCDSLEKAFSDREHAMQDLPIYNPSLHTQAVGFTHYQDSIIGTLLTPWCLNMMLFPQHDERQQALKKQSVGEKQHIILPAGNFEFIKGHIEGVGDYLSCSLLSPVFELESQELAVETALRSLIEALTAPESELNEQENSRQQISRRELLTGLRKPEVQPHA